MLYIIYSALLLTSIAAVQGSNNLTLNIESPLIRSVQFIQHRVDSREIIIQLQPTRRCLKPEFRVRLSGTSLYILDLQQVERDQQIYSYPPLVDPGAYFLEVIVLLCGTFNPDDLVSNCLEEVADGRNVVTLPYTFHVEVNDTQATAAIRPRWVLTTKHKATMLPTRYQKVGCKADVDPSMWWCPTKPADVAPYNLYHWTDGWDYKKPLHEVLQMSRKDNGRNGRIHICQIGDSHANMLVTYGEKLKIRDVKYIYIKSHFPEEFDINWLQKHYCSYAIVTYGQWPASSRTDGHPYNQEKYTHEMRRVLTLLQHYDRNQTQVFVRSENYNGLGASQTTCPPMDYRSPPAIDMYNNVLKNLTKELNIEFIDLTHIMGPMWDSAEDWNHPFGQVATTESEWILAFILQSSVRRGLGVTLYSLALPERTLVRFTDSAVVYLVEKDELRAFPNGHTFMAMGFDFGDVQVLDAKRREEALFGPDLPPM